jgi:hypothetical protein
VDLGHELQSLTVWYLGWTLLDLAKPFATSAVLMLAAWIISRYRQSEWQRELRGAFFAIGLTTVGILSFAFEASRVTSRERPLSAAHAEMMVLGEEAATQTSKDQFCVNIFTANETDKVAKGGETTGQSFGPYPTSLTTAQLDELFHQLIAHGFPSNAEFANEIRNNQHRYYTVCISRAAPSGYSYLIARIAWRDEAMADDEIGVTELCGFYVGDPASSAFHECPNHNRSYILSREANGNSN